VDLIAQDIGAATGVSDIRSRSQSAALITSAMKLGSQMCMWARLGKRGTFSSNSGTGSCSARARALRTMFARAISRDNRAERAG